MAHDRKKYMDKFVKQGKKCADKIVESESIRECYYSQCNLAKVEVISTTLRDLRNKQMIFNIIVF